MENETTYYTFASKILPLNESPKNNKDIYKPSPSGLTMYTCPLIAVIRQRDSFCHKIKPIGEVKPSRFGHRAHEVEDFIPIEAIDASMLMRRFCADLAIEASNPYKDSPGRGDGWTKEFVTYLETLDEGWREKNASWYSIGPNQLMRAMVMNLPAYALENMWGMFCLLTKHQDQNLAAEYRKEFKKRIETLFDLRRVQRSATIDEKCGFFSYDD